MSVCYDLFYNLFESFEQTLHPTQDFFSLGIELLRDKAAVFLK